MEYYEMVKNPDAVSLGNIPDTDYNTFYKQTVDLLKRKENHCLNYFVSNSGNRLRFFILIANDDKHSVLIYSHSPENDIKRLKSISAECYQMHIFEREIHEDLGIEFTGHPWLKPVRYSSDRFDQSSKMSGYLFYSIDSEEVHEVGVGPIHAGVIEPGHFRFICHGENVLHLEIQLGYQHRGIGKLFAEKNNLLQQSVLSETIAGDTSVGHALAYSQLAEAFAEVNPVSNLKKERAVALELERIAVHIGDTAALCADVGYQIGQVACEALRTMVINTTQDWCGNRFGKGLIRPGGTNFPLSKEMIEVIEKRLDEVNLRFHHVTDLVYNNSGIISRFENIGALSLTQALMSGATGMAARSTGLCRDIRWSHPFQSFGILHYKPAILDSGDVYARGMIRKLEFELSLAIIRKLLLDMAGSDLSTSVRPDYNMKLRPETLGVSIVEGWRGEICHSSITGKDGKTALYKIKDPSLHNWLMLALAVRGQEISDFPLCNKSFNLSYCGHDL